MADTDKSRGLSGRFLTACLCLLAGVVVLQIALNLLAQFWGWLVVLALLFGGASLAIRVARYYRDRR